MFCCHFDREESHSENAENNAQKRKPMFYKSSGGTIHIVARDFNP